MASFFAAIIVFAIFIFGFSITFFRKGRHIQTDVGNNDNMKRFGLECSTQSILREEAAIRGEKYNPVSSCHSGDCCTCSTTSCEDTSIPKA